MNFTKTIVVSAVNLVNGGTFTILQDFLNQLLKNELAKNYKIIPLVNNHERLPKSENLVYKDYKLPKKNWLFRLFYEYIYFFFLSLKIKPEVWISLHDTTPNVFAGKRFVYMHNSSPFFKDDKKIALSFKFKLFMKFYRYMYKLNVKKNTAVIVQQDWLRSAVSSLCKIDSDKIIVSYPEFESAFIKSDFEKNRFFFPSYPREFKNFDIICEAAELLKNDSDFKVSCNIYLTIDGSENVYSKRLYEKYHQNQFLHFVGLQNKEQMQEQYNKCECLIFPSKLETWGLPISEFKNSNKKMLLADLPYAKETSNNASSVAFFNPSSAEQLAKLIKSVCLDDFLAFSKVSCKQIAEPFCKNWQELIDKILTK